MSRTRTILILSDVHYACDAERERRGHETRVIANPCLRLLVRAYRRFIWLRDPFAHNHLLTDLLNHADSPDLVVTNGDYSCDTAFVGVSDDAACESARQCLAQLREGFGSRVWSVMGDHELGKLSLFGGIGGMRLKSWHRAQQDLALRPCWRVEIGRYVLVGITSSLVAFPVYEGEALPEERADWLALRESHMDEIRRMFDTLKPEQRMVLFCHDPTALPFLWREQAVRDRLERVEHTIIGHLHSHAVLGKSRTLAGMPTIGFLGSSIRRMTRALSEARSWKDFNVRLCPSLAGIQLLKDGGYLEAEIDEAARRPARFRFHALPWTTPSALPQQPRA